MFCLERADAVACARVMQVFFLAITMISRVKQVCKPWHQARRLPLATTAVVCTYRRKQYNPSCLPDCILHRNTSINMMGDDRAPFTCSVYKPFDFTSGVRKNAQDRVLLPVRCTDKVGVITLTSSLPRVHRLTRSIVHRVATVRYTQQNLLLSCFLYF